jgi:hypothetical protein
LTLANSKNHQKSNLATPRNYDLHHLDDAKGELGPNKIASNYTTEPIGIKPSAINLNRAKLILEHQEFRCHDEHPINRMNMKYNGLLTSKNSSLKSIKKVTPKRSINRTKVPE